MRVAHVMAGSAGGGAEAFFVRLCAALHRAGDDVLPLLRRHRDRAAQLAADGLAPQQFAFGGLLDLLTPLRLRTALRRFQPRVAVAWMNRAARMVPAGNWVLAGRLGGYYDLEYYRRCHHLIGNTRGLVAWMRDQGWPADRVHHLPNFAPDLMGTAPATLPVPRGARVVLALGRLHVNKAFDVLIRALPRLPHVHAVLAGDGPERAALETLARTEAVADRTHFLGWRKDGAALLAAANVLAVPSRLEPLGNVVMEAFSAGRPVVAADSAGPVELIRPGLDGLIVPKEDPAALASALGTVLDDQGLSTRLAAAGRACFLSDHAEAPVVARWRAGLAAMENA